MNLFLAAGVALGALKLAGVVSLSWLVVLAVAFLPSIVGLAFFSFMLLIVGVSAMTGKVTVTKR